MAKDEGKKTKKEKKEKKDKKSRKEKKSKDKDKKSRKDKRHSSSGSDSSSGSEPEFISPKEQLQRERKAVTILRGLLYTQPAVRQDLRQVLWSLDQGKAANLGGVPDEGLRAQIVEMLKALGCARAGSKDSYMLSAGQAKTLSVLGFVFDEAPRAPSPPPPQLQPRTVKGPTAPPPTAHQPTPPTTTHPPQPTAKDTSPHDSPQAAHHPTQHPHKPHTSSHDKSDTNSDSPSHNDSGHGNGGGGATDTGAAPPARRLGPALPPPEVLAAAAAAAAAGESEGYGDGSEGEGGGGDYDDMFVGPVPPELIEENEAIPEDAREAEVVRIMRLLKEDSISNTPASQPAPGAAPAGPDAYAVLGVTRDQPPGDVKKRYMKLSLLIHPDKCKHKDAHTAFQAVADAAKVLQDTGLRAALDESIDDKALRRMAEQAAIAEQRARAWRVARGEEPAGGVPGAAGVSTGPVPIVRESWMTELPPERAAALGGGMSQVSQRAFSRSGVKPRGDTSAWTDTPQDRQAKEQGGAQAPLLLTRGGAGYAAIGPASASDTADVVMETFASQKGKKSLLEQHMEQMTSSKAAKTDAKSSPANRPFDREKDLAIPRKAANPADLLKNQGALASKFSSAGGSRSFL